jgi:glycosyltransferase involved in cell wall biosynthesis
MRVAVNTRFLLPQRMEGFGVFTHEILRRMTIAHPEHEFVFLFDRPFSQEFIYNANVIPEVVAPQARHPVLWYLWFEWSLPQVFKKYKPDVFLSPDGYLSLQSRVPSVPVIHDLAFEHYPEAVPWLVRRYYRYFFPRFAERADAIATVSGYSKQDLVQQYQLPPDKIRVIYNGVSERFQPLSPEEQQAVKAELTQGHDYFIYVGAIHQRKNVPNLLRAFEQFKHTTGSPVKLVIAGRKAWGNAELERLYKGLSCKADILFTGSTEQAALARYVGAALALTYISYFEGFGIPLLEAMQCHVPVITSSAASMPEVAGQAGLINDPDDVEGIAKSMAALTTDAQLYARLVSNAKVQCARFSWDQTAERLWHVLEKAAFS